MGLTPHGSGSDPSFLPPGVLPSWQRELGLSNTTDLGLSCKTELIIIPGADLPAINSIIVTGRIRESL